MIPPIPSPSPPSKPPTSPLAAFAESIAHTRRTLALVWTSSRPLTIGLATLTLIGALVPLGIAYAGKRIVDAVVAHDSVSAQRWVLIELVFVVGMAIVGRGLGLIRALLGARLGVDINVTILERAIGLELRHFEDAEFYDRLTKARREASSRPVALVTESFQLLQSLITLTGYAALLIQFSGWAVIGLLVATIPATLAEMRSSKQAFRVRNWRSPESRRLLYLEYVLANDEHAKEVKLFGLGPLFLGRYRDLAEQFYAEDKSLAVRRAVTTQALSFLGTVAFYGAYVVIALLAASGRLTLGLMTLYTLALRQGQQAFQSMLGSIGAMYEHNLYMSNLFEFLAVQEDTTESIVATSGTVSSTPVATSGLVFEDVGFRYPDKADWAIRHVSLSIADGDSLALVGENGAGKTTLIKLLTRLYSPTEGRILLDGRDLQEWDLEALRRRFGVVFQDFNQYQLTVGENVGLGSVEHRDEVPRITRAIDRGGARELVASLAKGLGAQLGRWFKEGTDLSGGQWQKIALSRAFMREEADILILDEPTAALDAEAEHAVFSRFRELATGRTTIVISHRFPTVRMAQRIVVLEKGRVVESGSHDDLVARDGKYARMFALQAEGYR